MPPFLVPIADVAPVQGQTMKCTRKAVLPQFSNSPASGGPKKRQHYTNIFRVECLARTHPLVLRVGFHDLSKSLDKPTFNEFGRCTRYHQSPHDLSLSLGSRVAIYMGCSVNDAGEELLSLWWQPALGYKLTPEQESLAQAVFFDLVEAVHDVPPPLSQQIVPAPLP